MAIFHFQDKRLVRRMLRGDEAAFEEFFASSFAGLFRFARVRLGDESAAEEVAQATLCKAVRKLHTYRGEAALFSWLCTFCRREISDYLTRSGRAPEGIGLVLDLPEVWASLESFVDADGPDHELRRRELAGWVRITLDHLPPRYGRVLELKYLEELSVKDIATQLETSPKAVESLLGRARGAFRESFLALQDALPQGGAS